MLINMNKPIAFALMFCGGIALSSCNNDIEMDDENINEADAISVRSMEATEEKSDYYADLFKDPYQAIDDHARHSAAANEKDIPTLAKYLKEGTKTDLDRARAIYVWLTQNISYDAKGYNSASYGDGSSEAVLKNRIAVCEGFTNLFLSLGKEMGLEIEKVVGYAKGYGFSSTRSFRRENHAWNRIKIDGNWRIFDATWGEGYAENIGGKIRCTKKFDNYWFNVDPYQAIFDHYPKSTAILASIKPALDLPGYGKLPKVDKNYFRIGFDAKTTYETILQDPQAQFPKCYNVKTPVRILEAPAQKNLIAGKTYTFKMVIPAALKVALLDEHTNWNYMKEDDKGAWTVTYTPEDPGKINILLNDGSKGKSFSVLMSYAVLEGKTHNNL